MRLLENDNIRLRAIEPEDLDLLYKWENDTLLWDKGETTSPYSRYALKQYIAESHKGIYELKQQRMMIETIADKITVGMIDLYEFDIHNKKAGVGIMVDKEFQKKGYATEALIMMCNYAFELLSMHQVYAYIAVDNKDSIALFTRCGFSLSGTLTDWIISRDGYKDVCIYQKLNK